MGREFSARLLGPALFELIEIVLVTSRLAHVLGEADIAARNIRQGQTEHCHEEVRSHHRGTPRHTRRFPELGRSNYFHL